MRENLLAFIEDPRVIDCLFLSPEMKRIRFLGLEVGAFAEKLGLVQLKAQYAVLSLSRYFRNNFGDRSAYCTTCSWPKQSVAAGFSTTWYKTRSSKYSIVPGHTLPKNIITSSRDHMVQQYIIHQRKTNESGYRQDANGPKARKSKKPTRQIV